jgi:hypothetical protein
LKASVTKYTNNDTVNYKPDPDLKRCRYTGIRVSLSLQYDTTYLQIFVPSRVVPPFHGAIPGDFHQAVRLFNGAVPPINTTNTKQQLSKV